MAEPVSTDRGRVVGIADGDTITVLDAGNTQIKVRFYGIDAPEKGQPYGNKAKQHLSSLIFDNRVTVLGTQKSDRYGRTIGIIESNGLNVNLQMVEDGYAWWYEKYAPKEIALKEAQERAKAAGRGLWADPNAMPPWEYRSRGGASGQDFKNERDGPSDMEVIALMFMSYQSGKAQTPPPAKAPPATVQGPPPAASLASEPSYSAEVYVTETGTKYHRSNCRSLSQSRIPMSRAEAQTNYGPCGICAP